MAEPRLFDVRQGVTAEVLERLRRAQRVSLAIKNNRTAAFGIWVGDELNVVLVDSDPLLLLQVRRVPPGGLGGTLRRFAPRPLSPPKRGVVYDTVAAASDSFWNRLVGVLRVGDILRLGEDHDRPGLAVLHVFADQSRVASLRLPHRPHAHTSQSVA